MLFKADYWRLAVLGNICWQPLFDCGLVSDLWSLVSSGSSSALLGALRILPWGQFCPLSSVGWPAWSWGPSVLIIWASKSSSSFWLCLASFGWETFVGDAASDSWSLVCVDLSSRSLTVWFLFWRHFTPRVLKVCDYVQLRLPLRFWGRCMDNLAAGDSGLEPVVQDDGQECQFLGQLVALQKRPQ